MQSDSENIRKLFYYDFRRDLMLSYEILSNWLVQEKCKTQLFRQS